jgi:glycosyltransferase involved in cell wall biosynthesis
LRVVVNRQLAAGSKSGIGHYVAELLRCLQTQAGPDRIDSFPRGLLWRAQSLGARLRPLFEGRKPAAPVGQTSWRAHLFGSLRECGQQWLQSSFRKLCARNRYELYHEPNYVPLDSDVPTVATIPDLSVLLYPQWHPADRVKHFERRFARGLRQCVHLLSISEFVRQEILHTLPVRPEQVTCTYIGIRPELRPLPEAVVQRRLRRLGLPPRYLLCLGTLEPRKNVLLLLRVYSSLPEDLRQRWPLVLVGGWGWNRAEIAAALDEARHHGVIHLGYLPDEDLPAVYNGARALVFPSFYEGFGLPPLEMLACGGAVLASTAGALVETLGGRAHLIDPHDADGWRAGLIRVLTDDEWWQGLRRGGVEWAQPFSWERCAEETLAVYRRLVIPENVAGARRAG